MNSNRLVFTGEVSVDAFSYFASIQRSWVLNDVGDPDADVDEDRPSVAWRTPAGGVKFVDDTVIRCQYVEIIESLTGDAESKIRENFHCHDRAAAISKLDLNQSEASVRRGYRFIACLMGKYDRQVFDLAIDGLRSERDDIRESALIVPQYTHWVEFLPEVTRLSESDPSDVVRRIAGGIAVLLEFAAAVEES
ncbi:hypothetical protein ACFYY1_11485 [Streptomyces sp. NPDC001890]|uniref:hypothetical protein n=1 Tax=Streptomyces sp. NPDC001890 TaxID=3364620 RepID=UPI0036B31DDE